ncbi:MAG TPA: hypothetical protein VKZ60_14305 [Chloroflexota bacterium]|nr:hypothetical protein [Chloroflexota bacterium]
MNDEQRLAERTAVDSPNGEPAVPPEISPLDTPAQPRFGRTPEGPPAIVAHRVALTEAELLALLAAVFPEPAATRHWLASPARCGPVAVGLPASLDGWQEGRVWAAHAEVRWARQPAGRYRALYLAEGPAVPAGWEPLARDLHAQPGPALRLWGQRGADGRYHLRGRAEPLEYAGLPVHAGVAWVSCRYFVDAAGVPRFIRLTQEEVRE